VRIVAALAWYQEPVAFLDRCVRSLAGVVDAIVAVDGPWRLFEGGPWSPLEQAETIIRAARDVGIDADVHGPGAPFESQVAKRAFLMDRAGRHGDWVFVIDGDEYVAHADPEIVRSELETTDCLLAAVEVTNLHRGEMMPGVPPKGGLKRRIYRAGTTVVTVHSGYTYDGHPLLAGEGAVDLREHLRLEHDNCNRGSARNQLAREYRVRRSAEGVEVWV